MQIQAEALLQIVRRIFEAAGSSPGEAQKIAARLVEANLCGHDSHGVIRVQQYAGFVREGKVIPNQSAEVVSDGETVVVLDGRRGFGQVMAERAMAEGIERAARSGLALAALRNTAHVGRLADWAIMATDAGCAAIILCNGVGVPPIVVPHGGRDPRASTNPFAIAVPLADGPPLVLDFATSAIAEGKVRVARNKGAEVPPECLIDAEGRPTRDPNALYADPPGALLPFGGALGGHKGGGLALMCDLLAGAFSGGQCNHPVDPAETHFANNFLAIVIAPARYLAADALAAEIRRYVDYVKSARPRTPDGEVVLPGEPERRSRAARLADGIPIEPATWDQLMDAGTTVGLSRADLEALVS